MPETFRLDRKISFQNMFYIKCINVIIDSIGPLIILRSICPSIVMRLFLVTWHLGQDDKITLIIYKRIHFQSDI